VFRFRPFAGGLILFAALAAVFPHNTWSQETSSESLLENAFRLGSILRDTNNDKIADAVCGHIMVPVSPEAAENAAAANLAARLGYESAGITLPIVTTPSGKSKTGCSAAIVPLYIGGRAVPQSDAALMQQIVSELQIGEGGVIALKDGLGFVAPDSVGLLAAANAYAARAPYQWSVPGDKLDSIAKTINSTFKDKKVEAKAELVGVTYVANQAGIRRALLRLTGTTDVSAIRKAFAVEEGTSAPRFGSIRELEMLVGDGSRVMVAGTGNAAQRNLPSLPETPSEETRLLDLGTLYSMKGLLTGSAKKLVPSGVAAKLYIPAGEPGVALANVAARIGFETTGITLPLAFPATGISPSQVTGAAVVEGDGPLAVRAKDMTGAPGGTDTDKILPGQYARVNSPEMPALKAGEGEVRVVDRAMGRSPVLLLRGDEGGASAAADYASQHLPFLWEPSKKFASVEEIRNDLRRFFSLRSAAGQASDALFQLDHWAKELSSAAPKRKISSASVEVDVDEADPKLAAFIRTEARKLLGTDNVQVKTGSLHAGKKCCDSDPPLHYASLLEPFKKSEPTFAEDLVIPWEGRRLTGLVDKAAKEVKRGATVTLEVRVSEGPQVREKLRAQLAERLKNAGADPQKLQVKVLSAYKQGYSWLVDEIEPALKNQQIAKLTIEFAPYGDPEKLSSMRSVSRWVQELYPVDEVLGRDLGIPLKSIEFARMPDAKGPTYRVHAYGEGGNEVLLQEFSVSVFAQPYSEEFKPYDRVNIETGWVRLICDGANLLDERIATDPEEFWKHYQTETLPRISALIRKQNEGKPRIEFQPLFDTLKISFKMSEPEFSLGIDQERISSLEALQEDTLFSTQNYFYMLGDLVSNGLMDYQGRVIPVAYLPQDGQDGHVRIEFYGKDAGYPQVRLAWRFEGDPAEHEKVRKLPALAVGNPRLVAARLAAGQEGVESLTWRMRSDFDKYEFQEWVKLEPEEQVERSLFAAEQGSAQLQWLEQMHGAGLYRDSLAYPHLAGMSFEFELPQKLWAPEHAKSEVATARFKVMEPPVKRPQIADFPPAPVDAQGHFVSWEKPIGPLEEEHLLSRLSLYPGVNVYWMGRTYLGRNIWAADLMLPSPSVLHSLAKETTLKAPIIYSGRQHANEVSSTSHILKLAEELVSDSQTREALKKVNVVVHPITNVDGAQLAMDLAKITPENMLHPGYHASLTADLVTGQWEEDPVYPESSTRKQLWESWLPDAFLNPHGYPSHEWVQPFSEYSAWVITRMQAESGRAWWIPRGWFTSLGYLGDEDHRTSKSVTYALRDQIAAAMAKAPGVLEMNARMNDRYERYGQRWDGRAFQQPIYQGVRIYMALKGQTPGARANSFMGRFPDVTYDDGYTEAPDETAYGPWLHLVASAGLAYDHAHLDYLSHGKFKIKRTQKEFFDGVQWKLERDRPILPEKMPESIPETAPTGSTPTSDQQ